MKSRVRGSVVVVISEVGEREDAGESRCCWREAWRVQSRAVAGSKGRSALPSVLLSRSLEVERDLTGSPAICRGHMETKLNRETPREQAVEGEASSIRSLKKAWSGAVSITPETATVMGVGA